MTKPTKLPSLKLVAFVLGIPFTVLAEVLRFYLVGPRFKRFEKDVGGHVTLYLIMKVFKTAPEDIHFLSFYKCSFVTALVKLSHPKIVKRLPSYGEVYDPNSSWIVKAPNRKNDDPIIVFLHGGGYSWQMGPGQLETMIAVYELLPPEKREKVSMLFLEYRLASQGYTFPAQREQLHETYQNLTLRDGNSNIIFVGDSCGAHLALVYLQYLKILLKKNLVDPSEVIYPSKMVLVSPWVNVEPRPDQFEKGKSYYDNQFRDIIQYNYFHNPQVLPRIFGNSDLECVSVNPLQNPFKSEEWEDIAAMKNDILVIAGEHESLRDDILMWSDQVFGSSLLSLFEDPSYDSHGVFDPQVHEFRSQPKGNRGEVRVFIEPYGVHDSPFIFESRILGLLKSRTKRSFRSIDQKKYFGIAKMVEFLSETL